MSLVPQHEFLNRSPGLQILTLIGSTLISFTADGHTEKPPVRQHDEKSCGIKDQSAFSKKFLSSVSCSCS